MIALCEPATEAEISTTATSAAHRGAVCPFVLYVPSPQKEVPEPGTNSRRLGTCHPGKKFVNKKIHVAYVLLTISPSQMTIPKKKHKSTHFNAENMILVDRGAKGELSNFQDFRISLFNILVYRQPSYPKRTILIRGKFATALSPWFPPRDKIISRSHVLAITACTHLIDTVMRLAGDA
jgi:hypothetical protein